MSIDFAMVEALEIMKKFICKARRVLSISCLNARTSDVDGRCVGKNDGENMGTIDLEYPTIGRRDFEIVKTSSFEDASITEIDGKNMDATQVKCSSISMIDDSFMQWFEKRNKTVHQILAGNDVFILNEKQCRHLVMKLHEVVDSMWVMISTSGHVGKFERILKDLRCIVLKAFSLVEDCGGEELYIAAVYQLENKETFRELLLELECCFEATHTLYQKIESKVKINSIDFGSAPHGDVELDREAFKVILENPKVASFSNESLELSKYLVKRLEVLDRMKGGELNTLEFPDCGEFKKGEPLGKVGGFGSVYESKWLGLTCATKILNNPQGGCDQNIMENFVREASILAGLNHPNLVKFVGMGKQRDGWPFLMMEKMDRSVAALINEYKSEGGYSLPIDVSIDIIRQMASGMYYLHDMHVAHRDLKPDNVLWTALREKKQSDASSSSLGCVKLADFGISKIEVGSEGFKPDNLGTSLYRAPEVLRSKENHEANYFPADVYSFGITCVELLCGEIQFEKPYKTVMDLYEMIKDGVRPKLPSICDELMILIGECCAFNPLERPTFSEIWKRLVSVIINRLVGEKDFCQNACSSSKVHEVVQVEKQVKLYGVDEKVKEVQNILQGVNSLGIVGMGGLGKSTLAKALFDAEEGNGKFNKRCIHHIGKLQSEEQCLQVFQDILKKLDIEVEFKDLPEGKREIQMALQKNNIFLVLDDVWDQGHLNSIIPQDIFSLHRNSTLIVCSRNWDAIRGHVGKRYDLEPLSDGGVGMKLFFTHCFSDGRIELPSQFYDIGSKIVEACQGLPLSLKVVGAFLHGKERLRSWERVLQRLKRGRSPQKGDDWRIFEVLKISFDGLQELEKNMFLDICCFFLQDVCARLCLDHNGLNLLTHGESSLIEAFETLQHCSLLEVDEDMCLQMHDQLRDMGREIVELKVHVQACGIDQRKKYVGTHLIYPDSNKFLQLKKEDLMGVSWSFKNLTYLKTLDIYYCDLRKITARNREDEIITDIEFA